MPTHFHLLLRQLSERAIVEFMRRLSNAYVEYFNKKHDRVGSLFQGRYKAVLINEDNYLLHLSRYIHLNPVELFEQDKLNNLSDYPYSSYQDYLGKRNTKWIKKERILEYFKNNQDKLGISSYQQFVEEYDKGATLDKGRTLVGEIIL